ncbi:MAG: hypothetical protein SGBAC_010912 [Bacillariaceae sp.]
MTTTNSTKVNKNNEDDTPAYDVNGRKKKGFKTSSSNSDNSTQEHILERAMEVVNNGVSSPPQERRGSRVRRGSLLTARGESELLKDNSDRLSILMRDSNRGDAAYLSTSDESDFDE